MLNNSKRILLMGNPNVGKSVIFSKLTGMEVIASNYAGTTVEYTKGRFSYKEINAEVIDVPGTYSLHASSPAEKVAIDMLKEGADLIICVLDASNLKRNLELSIHLFDYDIPVVFALNLLDVANRKGLDFDEKILSRELDSTVIKTVAVKDQGIQELKQEIIKIFSGKEIFEHKKRDEYKNISEEKRWEISDEIFQKSKKDLPVKEKFIEKLGDYTIRPFPGILIAAFVLAISLGFVVGGGKAIRSLVLLPLTSGFIIPIIRDFVTGILPEGLISNLLVGEYGVIVKGIEWPFALILPYVFLFYIVLSFLEDSGYLPRLGVLMDSILRRIGLPGSNVIPFIMGYGCAIPAILGSRASATKKERLILASLISLAVPCTAQSGAFFALLGDRSVFALIFVYLISFFTIMFMGLLLNRIIPGKSPPMILEVPNLLLPEKSSLFKKIWIRMKHYLFEAQVPMMIGIFLAALIAETGFLAIAGRALEPLVEGWLGLPKEASLALFLGVIRRELTVMPLLDMNLTTYQLIVGSVVALFYLPCMSVFAILVKEFKLKVACFISVGTLVFAFLTGGILNNVFKLIERIF